MPRYDIVVIGASAGGIEALTALLRALPSQVNASLFVSVHFPAHGRSKLPEILTRAGLLPAVHVQGEQPIRPDRVYIAPPDYHLEIRDGAVLIDHGPRQNGFRPSIDVLFRSAARAGGGRVLGILLSGMLDDGVFGLQEIRQRGGLAVVQDPEEALFDNLPQQALAAGAADQVLTVAEMAGLLIKNSLTPHRVESGAAMTEQSEHETGKIQKDIEQFEDNHKEGTQASVITCPECGGMLWEINEGQLNQYRCHVGHVYSMESMLEEQARTIESALWTALRALRERTMLLRRLANLSDQNGSDRLKQRYLEQVEELERSAAVLRRSFLDGSQNSRSSPPVDIPPGQQQQGSETRPS